MGWDRLILCSHQDWVNYVRELGRVHSKVWTHLRLTPGFNDWFLEPDGTRHVRVTRERDLWGRHDCLFTLYGHWATMSHMEDPVLMREIGRLMVISVQAGHRFYSYGSPIELRPSEGG
jgi:hypothetical protein